MVRITAIGGSRTEYLGGSWSQCTFWGGGNICGRPKSCHEFPRWTTIRPCQQCGFLRHLWSPFTRMFQRPIVQLVPRFPTPYP